MSRLDQIESHTLDVLPVSEQPLPDYTAARHSLHAAIVDALDARDHDLAVTLIAEHDTSNALPGALVPADDAPPTAPEPRSGGKRQT